MASNYLDELNDIQRQAVTNIDGPVLVVAGPGSGKTRVLTYRIAHIIESGVPPWEILALTFTNKAAREMKGRIAKVVGDRADRVWAGTFHSIFARILRVEADKIGYPPGFTIYDTEDTNSVINAIIRELNLDKNTYNTSAIRSRISAAKSALMTPKLYADNEELRQQDRQAARPYTYEIYEKYVARCKRSGAMDFDDLLYRLYELFQRNPDGVLDKYRQKFRYVLVDEFQDTNQLQYAIIRKLVNYDGSPRNVCVVGDDAQSIYAFRGATIQNILDYEADFKPFGIKTFKLEQNYRSTEHIVQIANAVIMNNRRQIQKKIWSDKGEGHKVKVIKAMSDNEEGKRVTDTILEHKNRYHLSNRDIAILYRTNSQSRIFEENLRRYNVGYRVFGGLSFYQRKEVKDLIAYLRLVVNQRDEEALRRVLNYPKRGVGDSTIEKLSAQAGSAGKTMWECLPALDAGAKAKKAIADFVVMIQGAAGRVQTDNAYEIALQVARGSGLIDVLKSDTTVEGMGRLENVNALLDGIKSFVEEDTISVLDAEGNSDRTLTAYLQNIALLTDQDDNKAEGGDFVTLMSVHAAKGLEFKSVFVVGLEEKLFPSFMASDSPEALDEERRLFYVAVTRAEQLLTLSYANSRYRFGQMRFNEPSRFLEEVPRQHAESTAHFRGSQGTAEDNAVEMTSGAKVSGNFMRRSTTVSRLSTVDAANFKASPSDTIQKGMRVLHLKFGEGEVLDIEGGKDNRIATIFFKAAEDDPKKRIMLKFAKLQIVS